MYPSCDVSCAGYCVAGLCVTDLVEAQDADRHDAEDLESAAVTNLLQAKAIVQPPPQAARIAALAGPARQHRQSLSDAVSLLEQQIAAAKRAEERAEEALQQEVEQRRRQAEQRREMAERMEATRLEAMRLAEAQEAQGTDEVVETPEGLDQQQLRDSVESASAAQALLEQENRQLREEVASWRAAATKVSQHEASALALLGTGAAVEHRESPSLVATHEGAVAEVKAAAATAAAATAPAATAPSSWQALMAGQHELLFVLLGALLALALVCACSAGLFWAHHQMRKGVDGQLIMQETPQKAASCPRPVGTPKDRDPRLTYGSLKVSRTAAARPQAPRRVRAPQGFVDEEEPQGPDEDEIRA